MIVFDLNGELIPSKQAAGFEIGTSLQIIMSKFESNSITYFNGSNLNDALVNNDKFLIKKNSLPSDSANTTTFHKNDVVRLVFNGFGKLFCIFVFNDYFGKFKNNIAIGTKLINVTKFSKLYYDEGHEMHYMLDNNEDIIPGISFVSEEESIENSPNQVISSFCIHDWSSQ